MGRGGSRKQISDIRTISNMKTLNRQDWYKVMGMIDSYDYCVSRNLIYSDDVKNIKSWVFTASEWNTYIERYRK